MDFHGKQSIVDALCHLKSGVVLFGLVTVGCLPPKGVDTTSGKRPQAMGNQTNGNVSGQTAGTSAQLTIQLPELPTPQRQTYGQNSSSPISSVLLVLNPRDINCQGATKFADVVPYSTTPITKSVNGHCDYFFKMALVGRGMNGADETYYAMSSAQPVTQNDLSQQDYAIKVNLMASSAASNLGLPNSVMIGGPAPTQSSYPNPYPTQTQTPTYPQNSPAYPSVYPSPTPTPTPTPSQGVSDLPSQLADIILDQGSTQMKLGQFWRSKYLMVDFSQAGCGPCISHAEEMAGEQARFGGTSGCQALIVLPSGQISSWYAAIGSSTNFAAKISASYSGGHNAFARLIGTESISLTPTFVIIDRSGRVVGRSSGGEPRQASQYCP
jgi:hypothetical protein